jgi:hypothetical protein
MPLYLGTIPIPVKIHAGTAEPFGVTPAEPVVYLNAN